MDQKLEEPKNLRTENIENKDGHIEEEELVSQLIDFDYDLGNEDYVCAEVVEKTSSMLP